MPVQILLSLFLLVFSYIFHFRAVNFRKFTAINAKPISFSTFDVPRTENRKRQILHTFLVC